jgi:hypothetical protein
MRNSQYRGLAVYGGFAALVAFVISVSHPAHAAAPGDLDTSFDADGKVTTVVPQLRFGQV